MRLTFALAHLCVWSGILEVSLAKSWPQSPLKWFSPLFLTLNNLGKALAVHGEDHCICHSLICCGKVGAMEVRFSKWLKKGDMNLVLCISTLHNLAKVFAGWGAYFIYVWFETSVAFSKLSYILYISETHAWFSWNQNSVFPQRQDHEFHHLSSMWLFCKYITNEILQNESSAGVNGPHYAGGHQTIWTFVRLYEVRQRRDTTRECPSRVYNVLFVSFLSLWWCGHIWFYWHNVSTSKTKPTNF